MREIKNCKKCGRMFASIDGADLCKECGFEEEELFRKVREYLYDNPGTSIYSLSSIFNVNIRRIRRLVSEGKFEVVQQ